MNVAYAISLLGHLLSWWDLHECYDWALSTAITVLNFVNPIAWVLSNLIVVYIAVLGVLFVVFYQLWFDPRATTAGAMVWRFGFSILGVIGLAFIGIFIDPSTVRWFEFRGDTVIWRPLVRLAVYASVAYTLTSLVVVLWNRKFHPERMRTAPPEILALRAELAAKLEREHKERLARGDHYGIQR